MAKIRLSCAAVVHEIPVPYAVHNKLPLPIVAKSIQYH